MKKLLALAGLATALFAAVPMAAQADTYRHVERDGPRGGHYERDVYRDNDRYRDRHERRDWSRYDHRHEVRRMERRDFGYWRPHLERARYHHFGRPVFYDDYYRVPCRDHWGRPVMLTLSAYTGAILSVNFR